MNTNKETTTETTDVLFRKFSSNDGGDIIALFPGLPGTRDPRSCDSYQHIGQHGSAIYASCINATTPATPEQYKALYTELTHIGYNLRIVKMATKKHNTMRIS